MQRLALTMLLTILSACGIVILRRSGVLPQPTALEARQKPEMPGSLPALPRNEPARVMAYAHAYAQAHAQMLASTTTTAIPAGSGTDAEIAAWVVAPFGHFEKRQDALFVKSCLEVRRKEMATLLHLAPGDLFARMERYTTQALAASSTPMPQRYDALMLTQSFEQAALLAEEEARQAEKVIRTQAGQGLDSIASGVRSIQARAHAAELYQKAGHAYRAAHKSMLAYAAYQNAVRVLEPEDKGTAAWYWAQVWAAYSSPGQDFDEIVLRLIEHLAHAPPLPPELRPGAESMERLVRAIACFMADRHSGYSHLPTRDAIWACYVHVAWSRKIGHSDARMIQNFESGFKHHFKWTHFNVFEYRYIVAGTHPDLDSAIKIGVDKICAHCDFGPADVTILRVSPEGAGAKAGLRAGDVILRYRDSPVIGMHGFTAMTAQGEGQDVAGQNKMKTTSAVSMEIRRGQAVQVVHVPPGRLGVVVANKTRVYTPELAPPGDAATISLPSWPMSFRPRRLVSTSINSAISLPAAPPLVLGKDPPR